MNNSVDDHFMQGFSFGDSLAVLERSEVEMFGTDKLDMISKSTGGGKAFDHTTKLLQDHSMYLTQTKNWFLQNFE
jgi:hypothetical protein